MNCSNQLLKCAETWAELLRPKQRAD